MTIAVATPPPLYDQEDKEVAIVTTEGANSSSRFEEGLRKMEEVNGRPIESGIEALGDLGRYVSEYWYGDVYSRSVLNIRERELMAIAILTAQGGRERTLRNHLQCALNAGITVEELEEVLIHTTIYAGFPSSITAFHLLRDVIDGGS